MTARERVEANGRELNGAGRSRPCGIGEVMRHLASVKWTPDDKRMLQGSVWYCGTLYYRFGKLCLMTDTVIRVGVGHAVPPAIPRSNGYRMFKS